MSMRPASRARTDTAAPWAAPISQTSVPPGRSQAGAPAMISRSASRPSAPAKSAVAGSQSRTDASTAGSSSPDVGRVAHDERQRAGQVGRQRVEPRARGHPHGRCGPAHTGQVGAAPRRGRPPTASSGPDGHRAAGTAHRPARGRWSPTRCPRSAITSGSGCPAASSRATSATSCSVSGRGISTRRSTSRSSRRKAQWPEHVLERLAAAPPRHHGVQVGDGSLRGGLVQPERPLGALQTAGLLAQPPGLAPRRRAPRRSSARSWRHVRHASGLRSRRAGGPARRPSARRRPRPGHRPGRVAACRG